MRTFSVTMHDDTESRGFQTRLTSSQPPRRDEPSQAVLKYMAQDGCDRKEAQGNMDAFLENAQDWAYQKNEEKRGGSKRDYANANMEPKQVVLSTVWGVGVVGFLGNLAYSGVQGGGMSNSFHRTMELLGVNM